ncbi:MAG: methionyl-tRNA formyltransferase [Bacteroidales bacterium]
MIFQQSVVFFGTPEFAVTSLEALIKNNIIVKAVVTTPDKPTGRGKKITASPIKNYALSHNLKILQPENLSEEDFLENLQCLNADLFIVVAFRKLPSKVWQMPPLGTFNLHASLLPDYRGAAPINWAIINGEKETGVTTFFLNENIDEGKIIFSEKIKIDNEETFGELYDKMKVIGSQLLIKTTQSILLNKVETIDQKHIINNQTLLNKAPKILKPYCKINWKEKSCDIINKIRGLSPIPTANTLLVLENTSEYYIKIFKAKTEILEHTNHIGNIITDNKTFLKIATLDGYVFLLEIQIAGKNKMPIAQFLRGYPISNEWKAL